MKTLDVTSPYTTGPDVKLAQTALKTNVFKVDYLKGRVDGVFGEATGRASVRAKYWLGYDLDKCLPIYGDTLHSYLSGKRELSTKMKGVRAGRVSAQADKSLGVKAIEFLERYLGTSESPRNSNKHAVTDWYGVIGPWCAMFVTRGMVAAGSTGFVKGARYAYVPFMLIDARAGKNGLQLVRYTEARPGDIVCFDWQKGGPNASPYAFDHTGLLVGTVRNGSFRTLEGNTSQGWSGDQSNGGGVYHRDRDLDRATCLFIRAGR